MNSADRPGLSTSETLLYVFGFGLLMFVSSLACMLASREPDSAAGIWFPNALLAAALVRSPGKEWALWCAASMMGITAANLQFGNTLGVSLLLSVPNLLEALVLARIVRSCSDSATEFGKAQDAIIVFVAIAIGAASGALVASRLPGIAEFPMPSINWVDWFSASVIGGIVVFPVALAVRRECISALVSDARFREPFLVCATLVVLATILAISFSPNWYVFIALAMLASALYLPLVPMLLVSFIGLATVMSMTGLQHFDLAILAFDSAPLKAYAPLTVVFAPSFLLAVTRNALTRESEALGTSERWFRAIAQTTGDAIVCASSDGRIVFANQAVEETFGYVPAELVGQPLDVLMPEPMREKHRQLMESLEPGRKLNIEGRTRQLTALCRDGTEIPIDISVASWTVDKKVYVSASMRDIRARLDAQQALRDAERRWKFALESGGDGLWDINVETGETFYSDQWREIMGCADRDVPLTLEDWGTLVHPDDRAAAIEIRKENLRNRNKPFRTHEFRVVQPDGSVRWVRVGGATIERNPDGTPRRMIGTSRDITARKKAESERRHLLNRMTMATQVSGIGIWEWDLITDSLDWDDGMYALYGMERLDADPPYMLWEEALHPDDLSEAKDDLRRAVDSLGLFDTTFRILRHGEVRHIHALGRVIDVRDNVPTRMIGANWDVTAAAKANEQLRELNQRLESTNSELEQANNDVRNFAYIVSHDLRAPLINLLGFIEELQHGSAELHEIIESTTTVKELPIDFSSRADRVIEDDIDTSLAFMRTSVSQMEKRIDSVLRLARLGQYEAEPEMVNLSSVVAEIAELHRHQLTECHGTITFSELPHLMIDRSAIQQILENIIGNAVKYRTAERPLEVDVSSETGNRGVNLHIKDNGRGISEEDLGHIFDMFRRVGRQDTKGEGMGLAYTSVLVRRLGGRLKCESRLGEGTIFHLFLPADPGSESQAA